MATSAIGPGFLTQTAVFTQKYGVDFAFAILASIILDIGAQMNTWRVIGFTGLRGQDIGNKVLPGLGTVIAVLIVIGGLAFNIGNIAGAGLGLNVLFGINVKVMALISAIIAILIFLSKNAGGAMDRVAQVLGVLMILLVIWVMFTSHPPVGKAVVASVFPSSYSALMFPMITLVGGTVGGYITFAGGHRLVDAGITGETHLGQISKSSFSGVLITGIMRITLFLAILGVVAAGHKLAASNPPASAFQFALGNLGYKFFGIVLWSAAITSVIGAAYTSATFLQSFGSWFKEHQRATIIGFIVFSTLVFEFYGQPVKILVLVGSLNGLILPLTLLTMLIAARSKRIMGETYRHPMWLYVFGILALLVTTYAAINSLGGIGTLLR
ncbi:divalent metal cation transporter [Fodinisporobacter ferrooxydans]|uniref:Divalent metal cation transporter n=1 Tax=Fodinisporobacter ferrooxydans TaxID=2901836 RepID=A0ABY4CQQ3_9BACL|nr:divalent metal cation transporter [Alicyclobacillaceae bacterium MYW30-H2]